MREQVVAWATAVLMLLFCLAVTPLLLARSYSVRAIAIATHSFSAETDTAGREAVLAKAEAVRRSVDPLYRTGRFPPAWVKGAGDVWSRLHSLGLGDEEISHLVDVRTVFRLALMLAAVSAVGVAALVAPAGRGMHARLAEMAARRALILGAATAAVLSAVGAVAFEPFFGAFHAVFFKAGTWTFPPDSVLIQTFPERFWAIAAAAWAVGAVFLLAAVWLATFLADMRGEGSA